MNSPISNVELGKMPHLTGEKQPDRLKVAQLVMTFVIGLIFLVGCGVAPAKPTVVEAIEVADTTTDAVRADPLFITSADYAPGVWPASLTQGQPVTGSYEAQPLPNGQVAIKLKSDACHLSSDTTLIVSSGEVSGIRPASLTEGQSVVGRYET